MEDKICKMCNRCKRIEQTKTTYTVYCSHLVICKTFYNGDGLIHCKHFKKRKERKQHH